MTTTVRSVIRTSLLRAAAVPAFFIAASLAAQQPSEAGVSAAADAFIPTSFQARDVERSRFGSYVAIYHMAEGNSISLYDESLRQVWRTRLAHYWPASVEQGSVIQFAPDESYVLFPGFRSESDICVCDPRSGEPLEVLRGHEETVHVLALSTNGRLLLSASHDELILWERVAGRFVLRDAIRDFGPSVHSAEFLPDGRRVVISTTDDQERAVSVYEIGAQGLRSVFEHSLSDNNITHDIYQLAVSRSGSWFAAGYRESLMIFAVTGDEIRLDQTIEDIDLGVVYSLSFTPDDKHLVSGHFGYLRWWRSSSAGWTESATTSTQLPVANDVEFAADGRTLFVASFADENAV
ncbi:MAG: WD40 repeat domain-containing protein, partial [Spirochaetota bacterium]